MEECVISYLSYKAAVELKHLVHLSCQSINCSFNPPPTPFSQTNLRQRLHV